jgi:hypothetical protein
MIPNDQILKKCPFCGKDVKNLAPHIVNLHPKIMEKMDEMDTKTPENATFTPVLTQSSPKILTYPGQSINDMIREKLDTMLNIKIIEMLSKNPNVSLQEISAAIQAPQPQQSALDKLKELREYTSIISDIKGDNMPNESGGANEWLGVANAAIPIVKEMLQSRKKHSEVVKNGDVREGNSGSPRNLKRIQSETSGNSGKPVYTERQHSSDSGTEQQNHSSSDTAG